VWFINCQTIWQNSNTNDQQSNTSSKAPVQAIDQIESIQEIRAALVKARKYLKSIPTVWLNSSLSFRITQMIAGVARRHRGIEDQETLNVWIEMLQLNDIPELLKRLERLSMLWWVTNGGLIVKNTAAL